MIPGSGKIPWIRDRLSTPGFLGFPSGSDGKNLPELWETWLRSLGWEDPLEKGKATYSSILTWRVLWTKEPGRLWFTGSQRAKSQT